MEIRAIDRHTWAPLILLIKKLVVIRTTKFLGVLYIPHLSFTDLDVLNLDDTNLDGLVVRVPLFLYPGICMILTRGGHRHMQVGRMLDVD
jgi:hypothetical protein